MRKIITSALVFALVACAGAAFGGQVWTDANGDGVADTAPITTAVSSNIVIDLWMDSQSFTFTAYNIWAEWSGLSYVAGSATNLVTGCGNDPNDTFSHPQGIGFAGSICNPPKHGVLLVGRFTLHVDGFPSEVHGLIDPNSPFNVFSLISSPGGYMLFETSGRSTFIPDVPDATEDRSWGEIKGLYK